MSIFLDALLRMHKSASAHDLYGYWRERPEMVGGMGRLDTWICQVSNGSLLAKEGADGLLSVWSSNGNVRTGTAATMLHILPLHFMRYLNDRTQLGRG